MAFDLKQSLKLSQQLLMTPQLQQAIKLLQLSRLELEEFVTQQLAENPVLEEGVVESHEEKIQVEREAERTEAQAVSDHMAEAGKIVDDSGERGSEQDWESYLNRPEKAPTPSTQTASKDDDFPNHENLSRAGTLNDFLLSQLGETDLDEQERSLAMLIIGNIDERGYLQSPIEDLAQVAGVSADEVEDILDVVQRMEPVGVGTRDLKECLQVQLRLGRLRNGIVEKIVEDHIPDLETRNFQAIAKALKISLESVIENVQIIAELEPVPGRQFGGMETQYVVPDVYVFKVSGEWIVSLNEEGLPHLRISKVYEDMIESMAQGSEEKEYINDKMKSASWLIKSIQQRQRTILRVTEKLVERQKDFFEKGIEYLKPMVLRDIAEDIEMHESTISRVTSNKYVHTPQGIFELKYFFNSSVSRAGGDDLASASVKKMIADIIKAEDPKKPLADQKIVDILDERGIQLARRTVAKYREQMGILPSSKRKKYF
ncbi:RNA polymerase factor sigma-54 [Pseudobacteriovorax antillogorgiicola]|uniref:RNA polymerase, sigma 54 subunit, RpoN/SigL n=1 Tax=Pseudobacteriovorax antillogorgiicola TaxID=1513793 RepID=A0A1Y6B5F4_9BACT|nr:RNA polymerase factor sigma-54 [Pseudobacteriovorax antillogorgiicola]TCS59130.1 RNA polymerase RpoN-/SigL-like sigma 54 subunit [Pseudobacteriovorax antillogorgiicola]SME91418.1 RNA polymerase, sigma 54 subunit, RpoN/SigL [Pseudobacteriovorax antillogorgiicola]